MAQLLAATGVLFQLPQGPATPAVRLVLASLGRRLHALCPQAFGDGYRPELHYMRGGRTPGCRSLARR